MAGIVDLSLQTRMEALINDPRGTNDPAGVWGAKARSSWTASCRSILGELADPQRKDRFKDACEFIRTKLSEIDKEKSDDRRDELADEIVRQMKDILNWGHAELSAIEHVGAAHPIVNQTESTVAERIAQLENVVAELRARIEWLEIKAGLVPGDNKNSLKPPSVDV